MAFGLFKRRPRSKKKQRRKKNELPKEAKRLIKKISILFFVLASAAALIVLGFRQVANYIIHWDYFSLRHIHLAGESLSTGEAAKYCDIKLPQNLIGLNVQMLSQQITDKHPNLKEVRIEKKLPDTLIIHINRRYPVVQAELRNEYYLIDSEGFVVQKSASKMDNLPVIRGLKAAELSNTKDGICVSEKMQAVLELIRHYKNNVPEHNYQIEAIDISGRNYFLYISRGLEIRLTRDSFESKMKSLALVLRERGIPDNSYIDLRFSESINVGRR